MALRIVDVSSNQGVRVDWAAVARAGISGAFCKVVEGAGWFDETAPYNAAGIKAAGLLRGYYAFSRPDLGNSPQQEALYFLDHIPELAPGDLLALDLEVPTSGPGSFDAFALAWLQIVHERTGVRPLLYTGQWYAQELGRLSDRRLGEFGLWNAAYASEQPPAYAPWSAVTLWQHTDSSSLPGIGLVDESLFSGTVDQLRAHGVPAPKGSPAGGKPSYQEAGKRWRLDVAMHLRPQPAVDAVPLGRLLPAGTNVVEINPPRGLPTETTSWAYCRTGGDVQGYLLKSNMRVLSASGLDERR